MFSSLTSSPCLSLFIDSHSSRRLSPATLHLSHSLDLIPLSRRLLKLLDCVDDSFRRLLKRRDRLLLNLVSLKASREFISISRSFFTVVSDRLGNERKSFDDEFGSSRRKSLSINGLGFDFVSDENEAISQIINSASRFLQIRDRDSESWKRRFEILSDLHQEAFKQDQKAKVTEKLRYCFADLHYRCRGEEGAKLLWRKGETREG